jgi:hypothetical protein
VLIGRAISAPTPNSNNILSRYPAQITEVKK